MMNNLYKYKKLVWFANFMFWGQYKRDKRYKSFAFMHLFNLIIYIMIFVLTNTDIIFKIHNGIFWYLSIVLIINISTAMFERLADLNICIHTSLITKYHINFMDWLLLRFYYAKISIGDIANIILIFGVIISKVSLFYAIMFILVYSIFSHMLCSIFSYMFMAFQIKNFVNIILVLFYLASITVLFWGRQSIGKNIDILGFPALLTLFIMSTFAIIALFFIHKNRNKINKWSIKCDTNGSKKIPFATKMLLSGKSIGALKVLLVKEYTLLFKHKITILLQPFVYIYMMLAIFEQEYLYVLISFFVLDLSFYYGANYFGLEEYPFIYTIQASFDKKYLFRSKNIMFLILSFLGIVINIVVFSIFMDFGLHNLLQMIVTAFFTISVVLFTAPILSIYFFNTSYSKKKYVIQNLFVMVSSVIISTVFSSIIFINKSLTILSLMFTLILFITSVYFSIINPTIYTSLLENRKDKILAILREK